MMGAPILWWTSDASQDRAGAILAAVDTIDNEQTDRHAKNERCLRMYGQRFNIGDSYVEHVYESARKMLALNVVRSIADTVHAELTQNRPHPTFATSGDDMAQRWTLQRKARKLEQFVEGIFDASGVHETTSRMVLDATIFDGAACKIYSRGADIIVERVLPFELFVDDHEALYGKPRTLYQRKYYDRLVLAELFPKKRRAILESNDNNASTTGGMWGDTGAGQVLVTEAWRLPDKSGGKGRHCIVIANETLLDEPWEDEDFPFVFFRWSALPVGFWGESIANQLTGVQYEINKLLLEIQDAHHLLGKAHVFWPVTAGAVKTQWNNQIGAVVQYMGAQKPTIEASMSVHPEVYAHLERLYRWAYEIVGVSQLGAQAKKPEGLDSGKALMVYEDANSRRFVAAGRVYEQLHVEIAKQIIRLARRIYADDPKYKIRWSGKRYGRDFVSTIPWADVDMTEDMFTMRVFPTSILPRTPAGRTALVEQWINAGWLSSEEGMRLLDIPDIDAYSNIRLASWDLITEMIDRMLDADDPTEEGVYQPPEPFMDLKLAIQLAQGAYLRARLDGCPEENLGLLRNFLVQCTGLQEDANTPPPAPTSPAPEGMPPGAPAPPPQPNMPQPLAA